MDPLANHFVTVTSTGFDRLAAALIAFDQQVKGGGLRLLRQQNLTKDEWAPLTLDQQTEMARVVQGIHNFVKAASDRGWRTWNIHILHTTNPNDTLHTCLADARNVITGSDFDDLIDQVPLATNFFKRAERIVSDLAAHAPA